MALRAELRDGRTAALAAEHGATIREFSASLTADSLTGSAVPLADAVVTLADGEKIPYAEVSAVLVETFEGS